MLTRCREEDCGEILGLLLTKQYFQKDTMTGVSGVLKGNIARKRRRSEGAASSVGAENGYRSYRGSLKCIIFKSSHGSSNAVHETETSRLSSLLTIER